MLLLFIFIHSKRYLTLQLKHCLFVVFHSTTIAHERHNTTGEVFPLFVYSLPPPTSLLFIQNSLLYMRCMQCMQFKCVLEKSLVEDFLSYFHRRRQHNSRHFFQWIFHHIHFFISLIFFIIYRLMMMVLTGTRKHPFIRSSVKKTFFRYFILLIENYDTRLFYIFAKKPQAIAP